MKDKIIIICGGGHSKVIVDHIKRIGEYEILGYTDFVDKGPILGVKYLGTDDVLINIIKKYKHCKAVIGMGNVTISDKRFKIYTMLKELGFYLPVISAKSAIVNEEVKIGEGTVLFDNVIINVCSNIGKCAIINTGVIIEHDCELGDFTHIATGAVLSGGVKVRNNSMVGSGATVLHDKIIGENCMIGSGSVVTKNCLEAGTYVGIPAAKIK